MNPTFEKEFTFDRVVRIIIGALIIIGIFIGIRELQGVLIPFFVAWSIAYLLYPIVKFFQFKLKFKNRLVSIFITMVLVAGTFTLLFVILMAPVRAEISKMAYLIREFVTQGHDIQLLPDAWESYLREIFKETDIVNLISLETVAKYVERGITQSWKVFSGSLNFVLSLLVVFIVLLYIVFILLDYEKLSHEWKEMIPIKYREFVIHMTSDIEHSMNKYFRGQALIALTVGVLFATGFYIIDLPLGILLGIFIGVLNLVPYLQTVGFIPLTFMAALKAMDTDQSFGVIMLSVFVVFALVQGFQEGFLIPKIMGKQMGMHPAIILLSLTIWGSILGLIGMIIALPLTTLIISYYKRYVLMEGRTKPLDGEKPES